MTSSGSPLILPTHTCFDDALELIAEFWTHGKEMILVHAICQAPDGHEYSHAWIEDEESQVVLFAGILNGRREIFCGAREEYYAEMNVQEQLRYTVAEASRMNRESGHFGPWEDRYRALCSDRAKGVGR